MNKLFSLLFITLFLASPSIAQTKKELKAAKKQEEYISTKELINSKQYEFTGEWATSNRGRRINLMSNPTYMKIDNTSADGFFPFFGTGYSGAAYASGGGGIEFKNELENYNVSFNDKKYEISITFKVKGENDYYDILVRVFAGGNTSITISSNNRSTMNYSGNTKTLEKKESK